jgi:hypothetical protein
MTEDDQWARRVKIQKPDSVPQTSWNWYCKWMLSEDFWDRHDWDEIMDEHDTDWFCYYSYWLLRDVGKKVPAEYHERLLQTSIKLRMGLEATTK